MLSVDPLDAIWIGCLPPGNYGIVADAQSGATGVGIIEAYGLETGIDRRNTDTGLRTYSARAYTSGDSDPLILAFHIKGDKPQSGIVRARGPSLAQHGLDEPLEAFELTLLRKGADGWSPGIFNEFAVIKTPLDSGDAFRAHTFEPGEYAAILTPKNGASGVALLEFELDPILLQPAIVDL